MDKYKMKVFKNLLILGIIWTVILFLIALALVKRNGYSLRNVVFVEGIISLIIGALSGIGGNSMGLSANPLVQNKAQYDSIANIEIKRMETQKIGDRRVTLDFSLSNSSLLVSGVLLIIGC